MKLTKHQEQIVEEIIKGNVYDIPSYLEVFNKGHVCQYDIDELHSLFNQTEGDKTYSFKEENSYYYTEVFDSTGTCVKSARVPNKLTYEFRDYPLQSPVKAELDINIKPETLTFNSHTYTFNFLSDKIFVADTFDDILDFIALWAYFVQEALVIEVEKPIDKKDLSIFFEKIEMDTSSELLPYWKRKTIIDSPADSSNLPTLTTTLAPYMVATNYITKQWKPNMEHLMWCEKYIQKVNSNWFFTYV